MTPKETCSYAAEQFAGIDVEKRRMRVCISTYDLDYNNRRIDQSGWDFTRFKKNPVILLQHDGQGFTGSNGLPVAKGLPDTIRVEGQKTYMDIEFPPPGTFELADTVFGLIQFGAINTVSVSWDPFEVENAEEAGQAVRIFRKQELVEVSIVSLPANPSAVIERASAEVKQLAANLEKALKDEHEERAAGETIRQYRPSHLLMCAGYFDRKKPANKASTKYLKHFYETAVKAEPPQDEVAAWEEMPAHLDRYTESLRTEAARLRTELEQATKEIEAAKAQPKPKTDPAAAPRDERTASVRLTLSEFRQLPQLAVQYAEAAAEALLLKGVPVKDLRGGLDAIDEKMKASLLSSFRNPHACTSRPNDAGR